MKAKYGNFIDFTKSDWDKFYEDAFGGFHDLGDEDSEEEHDDENEEDADSKGNLKDFVTYSEDDMPESDEDF